MWNSTKSEISRRHIFSCDALPHIFGTYILIFMDIKFTCVLCHGSLIVLFKVFSKCSSIFLFYNPVRCFYRLFCLYLFAIKVIIKRLNWVKLRRRLLFWWPASPFSRVHLTWWGFYRLSPQRRAWGRIFCWPLGQTYPFTSMWLCLRAYAVFYIILFHRTCPREFGSLRYGLPFPHVPYCLTVVIALP